MKSWSQILVVAAVFFASGSVRSEYAVVSNRAILSADATMRQVVAAAVAEACYDGVDNDLDGQVDEGCGISLTSSKFVVSPGESYTLSFRFSANEFHNVKLDGTAPALSCGGFPVICTGTRVVNAPNSTGAVTHVLSSVASSGAPQPNATVSVTVSSQSPPPAPAPGPGSLPSGKLTRFAGNPLVRNGPESYDFWKTGPRVILKIGPGDYRMWYEALGADNVCRVGYATSSDGLTWQKRGVVMSPDRSWEREEISPNAILVEGGVFKMWYHAGGYLRSGKRLGNAHIGYATSTNGLNWSKPLSKPVFTTGAAGSFEDDQVAEPRVVKVGTQYRMYYTGRNTATQRQALGLATSVDGVTWTRYSANPLLPANRFGGFGGALIVNGGTWHLWHATADNVSGLIYKWSSDGIKWTDGPQNPVLVPSGDRNTADYQSAGDSVSGFLDGTTYRIFYSGFNSNFRGTGRLEAICMATISGG